MAIDPTKILGKGQIYWGKDETPIVLKIGDGQTPVAALPNVIDKSDVFAAISALNAQTLKVSADPAAKTIAATLDDLLALATGAKIGIVFETSDQLMQWLDGTYTRPDGIVPADLVIGQDIYIEAEGEPDYWWNGTNPVEMEVGNVNLSGYSTTSQVQELISMAVQQAINSLPAFARLDPPSDGNAYNLRDGSWEKAVIDATDLESA